MNADHEIYRWLLLKGCTTSKSDYSLHYLGMAPNYACVRRDRGLSARAQINLFRRLWDERHYILAARVAWLILWGFER